MAVFNNEMLFNGVDSNGRSGLWVTDGTAGGTHDLFAGAGSFGLNPTDLTQSTAAKSYSAVSTAAAIWACG